VDLLERDLLVVPCAHCSAMHPAWKYGFYRSMSPNVCNDY
jgi:hypothetical protein